MIRLTRLNGQEVVVNADLIEFLESTPETIVSMTTGKKVVVKEKIADIIRLVAEFRARIMPVVKSTTN
jgi:flagellar protein FlbD